MLKTKIGYATDILKKAIQMVLSLLVLSLLVFYMARLSPGDPLKAYYGDGVQRMSTAQQTAAMERLGLDQPIYIQYGAWLKNALRGDFGISYQYKRDVLSVIGSVYQNTLFLGLPAYLLTFALALPLGAFCALREGRLSDRILCKIGAAVNCIPSFWVSLLLILLCSVWLGVLPSGGAYPPGGGDLLGRLRYLILPLTVLVISHLWYYACMVRNLLLEEIRRDYVLFCKSKGMSRRRILWRHCMRGILPAYASLIHAVLIINVGRMNIDFLEIPKA